MARLKWMWNAARLLFWITVTGVWVLLPPAFEEFRGTPGSPGEAGFFLLLLWPFCSAAKLVVWCFLVIAGTVWLVTGAEGPDPIEEMKLNELPFLQK